MRYIQRKRIVSSWYYRTARAHRQRRSSRARVCGRQWMNTHTHTHSSAQLFAGLILGWSSWHVRTGVYLICLPTQPAQIILDKLAVELLRNEGKTLIEQFRCSQGSIVMTVVKCRGFCLASLQAFLRNERRSEELHKNWLFQLSGGSDSFSFLTWFLCNCLSSVTVMDQMKTMLVFSLFISFQRFRQTGFMNLHVTCLLIGHGAFMTFGNLHECQKCCDV